ncbi:MAG: zinc-dependent alcohol dehydrogenase family protein [Planctomycetia bacterium]|nr:zinc-dependent alcohol dehydrogenase family protein [Planctomycetia bacterium]
MRAVVFDRVGDPAEVLQVREVDRPVPGRGEVLVRMIASPVNPSDLMYIRGEYGIQPKCPATPGFEGVGVVEASGGGILGRFRKGKRVAVVNDRRGNWGEYAITTARQVIPVPADIPDAHAATFFVNPATALALTRHVLNVAPDQWLAQSAAAGALGTMIVRLGRKFGFRTVNVVRHERQIEPLKTLGADVVLVDGADLPERIRHATGGGAPFAIDPVGGETGTRMLDGLAPGGRLVVFGSLSGRPIAVDPRPLIARDLRIENFWLGRWAKQQRVLTMLKLFKTIRSLAREGVLSTERVEEFPMDRVTEAVSRAAEPGAGKVLLRIAGEKF